MMPRNKASNAAKLHYNLIPARMPAKRNDARGENMDQHYLSSQCKYLGEFATKYQKETVQYSGDTMNKVLMGPPAVSRYHQPNGFMPVMDSTNQPDHDFPSGKNYKLQVAGFMHLNQYSQGTGSHGIARSRSATRGDWERPSKQNSAPLETSNNKEQINQQSPFEVDNLKRPHFRRFISGQTYLKVRSDKHLSENIATHTNDLKPLIEKEVKENKKRNSHGGSRWRSRFVC